MKQLLLVIFILLNPNILNALELKGDFFQGNLILGKTESNSSVFIDKKKIKISKQGFFVFGLSKDRKNDLIIELEENVKMLEEASNLSIDYETSDDEVTKDVVRNYSIESIDDDFNGSIKSYHTSSDTSNENCSVKCCDKDSDTCSDTSSDADSETRKVIGGFSSSMKFY